MEQTATLRLMPNLDVWRPSDSVETVVAWTAAIERADGPTALVLSRQSLPFQPRDPGTRHQILRGGYVLRRSGGKAPSALLLATGSEVELAVAAQEALAEEDIPVWVVSMPCTDVFDRQESEYKESVLPRGVPRVAVEAGVSDGWRKYVLDGAVVGIDTFGESAPGVDLLEYFGFTVENVVKAVKGLQNS